MLHLGFSPRLNLFSNFSFSSVILLTTPTRYNVFCYKYYSKYEARETRFMTKLISKGEPRKKFRVFESLPSASKFPCEKSSKKVNKRRITVLNKLFMQHITDLMATGNWQDTLIDKGIEITNVAVTPDFKNINVFWFSSVMNNDVESLLSNVAHRMHHELTQLQLMGTVPKISFVKDKHKEKLLELDNLLLKIPSNSNNCGNQAEKGNIDFEEKQQMAMNVYGLEHDKIMKKIGFGPSKKYKNIRKTSEFDKEK